MIPAPELILPREGEYCLGANPRVCFAYENLAPLARILAKELSAVSGRSAQAEHDPRPVAGDIALFVDQSLPDGSSTIEIDEQLIVRGRDYRAVARGTSTCLQLLNDKGCCACGKIQERRRFPYSGLMLDLARKPHDFQVLKDAVVLCRFYKIRHLHLHFTDDQAHTFPSSAFPQLGRERKYSLAQMRELENLAAERGVEIVPEMDLPGHSRTLVHDLPFLRCDSTEADVLCPGRDETYRTLETLIREMTSAFPSSSYFHIGADEFKTELWRDCPRCRDYMKRHRLRDVDELFCHFVTRLDQLVRACGKRTLIWEGFHPAQASLIPKHIPVMVFESLYATAPELLAAGFQVINTSWQPLYVVNDRAWSPEQIHAWNPYRWENWWEKSRAWPDGVEVSGTKDVLGAQICAWEQPGEVEIASLSRRAAALMERLENPGCGTYADFARRLDAAEERLAKILAIP
ncbi:MAG TPA: family 20 glycosylhydrolase [Candidatus Methylacidiphilales bacterium]|jgi:hexosaminidase|nr:family 20 glycosylhydrolase [Candidatus Methylacidiphilales bacterium]